MMWNIYICILPHQLSLIILLLILISFLNILFYIGV